MDRKSRRRGFGLRVAPVALLVVLGVLFLAPGASAAIPDAFDGDVSCSVAGDGTRECGGTLSTVKTFDGTPIDVNVAFPAAPATGPDGNYPMIMVFHGYGGKKISFSDLRRWTDQGYAAFTMSDRGFGDSCGSASSRAADMTGCAQGWVRLLDTRYEVRDAQLFAGMLVDEGLVDPAKIGATGGSYGGGLSMALAALKDRVMLPDGSLVPWQSPEGTDMQLAAAAPEIPWSDLAYSLVPNGRTLDYVKDAPYGDRYGVMKQSFVGGLYASGLVAGYYAPAGLDPDADLPAWFLRLNAGEPYEGDSTAEDILDEVTTHHSSYYIDHSQAPAPLLISNGWTDDLFPPDEAIRFYNRTRTQYPDNPINLYFLDYGHQRGQNKAADIAKLDARQNEWFDYYVKGNGAEPEKRVEAITTTLPQPNADKSCPKEPDPLPPSAGPFSAPTWAGLSPGEVRLEAAAEKTISPLVPSDSSIGKAFDPITGPGACASASGADQTGAATYRMPTRTADSAFTMLGSPTVIADITSAGATSQLSARLLDVAPDGTETLVARGVYRPDVTTTAKKQVFQLHADAWKFEPDHTPKLELLPSDSPYDRAANGQQPITVANLQLRLPSHDEPGSADGVVDPLPKYVPAGYELADDYKVAATSKARCDGKKATIVGTSGVDVLVGTPGRDVIAARKGNDTIRGRGGNDLICGQKGRDQIRGQGGDDVLRGSAGADDIKGSKGDDDLSGGKGRDDLSGGPGDDHLNGGPGKDLLRGGPGKDTRVNGRL